MLKGSTKGSYFWDDGSGRQGDTGMPAIGKPMQKGLFSSPSWPLGTEGYVTYKGKKASFFIGDRGPGAPSRNGVMLDIDGKTFAYLTGGTWNSDSLTVEGNGGEGQISVDYVVTKWGNGTGRKNYPVSFASGAWAEHDSNPAKPIQIADPNAKPKPKSNHPAKAADQAPDPVKKTAKPASPKAAPAEPAPRHKTAAAPTRPKATGGPISADSTADAAQQTSYGPTAALIGAGVLVALAAGAIAMYQRSRPLLGRTGKHDGSADPGERQPNRWDDRL